jgi:hypothetical protein
MNAPTEDEHDAKRAERASERDAAGLRDGGAGDSSPGSGVEVEQAAESAPYVSPWLGNDSDDDRKWYSKSTRRKRSHSAGVKDQVF